MTNFSVLVSTLLPNNSSLFDIVLRCDIEILQQFQCRREFTLGKRSRLRIRAKELWRMDEETKRKVRYFSLKKRLYFKSLPVVVSLQLQKF